MTPQTLQLAWFRLIFFSSKSLKSVHWAHTLCVGRHLYGPHPAKQQKNQTDVREGPQPWRNHMARTQNIVWKSSKLPHTFLHVRNFSAMPFELFDAIWLIAGHVYKMNITKYEIGTNPFEQINSVTTNTGCETSYSRVGSKIYFRGHKNLGWFDMGGFSFNWEICQRFLLIFTLDI